jgi:hypothetical protein
VRVVRIHGPPEAHDALDPVDAEEHPFRRLPSVNDTGTIVLLVAAGGRGLGDPGAPATRFIVERVNTEGELEWLAEFARDELERVSPST